MRSPYVWVAIGGLVLIPLIRPLTRQVPPPPAVTGRVPSFQLADHEHRSFGDRNLSGHVYLATFLDPLCQRLCEDRLSELAKLERRCRQMGVKLWLVTVSTDAEIVPLGRLRDLIVRLGGTLESWTLLAGPAGSAQRLRDQIFQPLAGAADGGAVPPTPLRGKWSILVDGDGNGRGAYPTDADGLYEVFHRAQHVMSLREAWRR